jgi:16S rRNA (cytosine1402-N4)-methyltransferase
VIIAFHSLEDRAVKQAFARLAHPCQCPVDLPICRCGKEARVSLVTRRPLRPDAEEVLRNPRSRSARLRVAEKL